MRAHWRSAHWRQLANTIEPVLPSAHPSPQTKRQIDRFSHFCTAHGTASLYFTTGRPQNCPFPSGIWTRRPHLIHGSLGAPESSTETAPGSV